MLAPARVDRIPLPKGWPNRTRSAVIHAICLAHFSLTFARSVNRLWIADRARLARLTCGDLDEPALSVRRCPSRGNRR